MTQGRWPKKAIAKAKPIAETRGEVRYYQRGKGVHPHFSIVAPNLLAEIIVKPTESINAPLSRLEAEAAAEIAAMKLYPASQQISREIWFSSRNYSRRYFRITATGLIELAPDGSLLPIDIAKIEARPGGTGGAPGLAPAAGSPASPAGRMIPAAEYPDVPAPAPKVPAMQAPAPEQSGPAVPAPAPVPASQKPA